MANSAASSTSSIASVASSTTASLDQAASQRCSRGMEGSRGAGSPGMEGSLKRKRGLNSTDSDTPRIDDSEAPRSSTKPRTAAEKQEDARQVIAFSKDGPVFESNQDCPEFCNCYESPQPYEFKIPVYALQPNFPHSVWCLSALNEFSRVFPMRQRPGQRYRPLQRACLRGEGLEDKVGWQHQSEPCKAQRTLGRAVVNLRSAPLC